MYTNVCIISDLYSHSSSSIDLYMRSHRLRMRTYEGAKKLRYHITSFIDSPAPGIGGNF